VKGRISLYCPCARRAVGVTIKGKTGRGEVFRG